MKKLLAITLIGLFALGTMAGCIGNDEANEIYEEEIEESLPVREDFRAEYSGDLITAAAGSADIPFPVEEGANKIILTMTASGVPGVIGGVWAWVWGSEGGSTDNAVAEGGASSDGTPLVLEIKEKHIKQNGYGDWNIHLVSQIADITTHYDLAIEVIYN